MSRIFLLQIMSAKVIDRIDSFLWLEEAPGGPKLAASMVNGI
jgi:hypothetical protein